MRSPTSQPLAGQSLAQRRLLRAGAACALPSRPQQQPKQQQQQQQQQPHEPTQREVLCAAAASDDHSLGPQQPHASLPQVSPPDPQELAASLAFAKSTATRRLQRRRQQLTYQASAIAATGGVSALAVLATYYKFSYMTGPDSPFPWADMAGTLALVFGGAVGMEMWARWAHRALWHDFQPGWALHKSHHEPRIGPFEANDVYAVVNAVPAIALCLYGFLTPTMAGSLAFGAGLGITLFGIAYMFVHDGLVHKRFPVGPIAELPYMKKLTIAHRLHHSEKYGGVPWGLFLAPQELEAIGAGPELDRLVEELDTKSLAPSRR